MNWRDQAKHEFETSSQNHSFDEEFDVSDIIAQRGSSQNALIYAFLFSPETIEVEGLILLKDNIYGRDIYLKTKECRDRGLADVEIERSFNLVEVGYLFNERGCPDRFDRILASALQEIWTAIFRDRYKDVQINVELVLPKEDGETFSLTFYKQP